MAEDRQESDFLYEYRDLRCCNLKTIKELVEKHDKEAILSNSRGIFGYTLLHEIVASGKADVLDYLLEKSNNTHVNCQAKNGYTPLHLAASLGHEQCVRTLLQCGADISITDEFGKTPKQTAELSSKANIVWLLRSEEIIKEAGNDRTQVLTELLRSNTDQLEPDCLDRALMAATVNDNHFNIGKLVIKGAKNLEECLDHAQRNNKPHACAMLMLIKAALTNNRAIVQKLFGETVNKPGKLEEFNDAGFSHIQKVAQSGKVSTVVPIEIARRNRNPEVRKELLLKTDVNKEEGYVYWHGLRLLQLEVDWLCHISWVKKFRLARNGFKCLPDDMGSYLKQVVNIDLQHNNLTIIPRCLLELLSLVELNLSHNKLTEIPDVPEWPLSLMVLDLSFNQLTTLPSNTVAFGIHSLNLSHNYFHDVPLCICSFTTLHSLDLSDNPDILTLPTEMGRLSMLKELNFTNLKDLEYPPRNLHKDPHNCQHHLHSQLRCATGFYRMKLMVVGPANRGKTTLVERLKGKRCGHECTVGVDVSEWWFGPSLGKRIFFFSVWDFAGAQEYHATHQCFLSPRSLYLLLFSLKDGDNGVQELKPWLNNLALQAPRSCVIIVGTHLDKFPKEKREEIDALLHKVGDLAESYRNKLQIVEVMPVGLKNCIENVGLLKEAIYNHAANYKTQAGLHIMGQKVPSSYCSLYKKMEVVEREVMQGKRDPVMQLEEFTAMVKEMNKADIQDEEELKTVTLFLIDAGSLLHYDHHRHNLSKLFFVHPQWLCDMMSRVLTIKVRNPFVKNSILHCRHIPVLFKDDKFPWQYLEHYLTILHRLEMVLLLDDSRVLIPSVLPLQPPEHLLAKKKESALFHSRYIFFDSADTPPGFWGCLLHRIMHSIPQVSSALAKTTLDEKGPMEQESLEGCDPVSLKSLSPSQFSSQAQSASLASAKDIEADVNDKSEAPLPSCNRLNISQLLPNSSSFLSIEEAQNVQLDCWRTGLYYSSPGTLMFSIESITKTPPNRWEKDGVLIKASPTNQGKNIICQLVDLVFSVVKDWYPGLAEGLHGSTSLEQVVPCFECLKLARPNPFEFRVEQCLSEISQNKTTIECGYHKKGSGKNHTVCLADIVPDLLLQDISSNFHLSAEDISCQEDDSSLLEKGEYGKIYRGRCLNKLVAIKKYTTHSENSFFDLRSEAKHFQQLYHPCLMSLVGACIQPTMALVLEEPPLRTLEFPILKRKIPVHRLTIFRIVAEVAAALRFLHRKRIIFHDLKAANVLLWTLDPASLCHCKVTDFAGATAMHMPPLSVRGLQWTKGFVAPEVLRSFKKSQLSMYDHRADIFSFGMFLYQMIARRHPYHDIPPHRIDVYVEAGERPKLQDVEVASTGYHYLTLLMRKCWKDNPKHRPTTEQIIKTVCLTPVQSVMCVFPIQSKFSLSTAIALTPAKGVCTKLQNQLWLCCDGEEEDVELVVYNTHTMMKAGKSFLKHSKVLCMALCNNNIWVASRESSAGLEPSVISIFDIVTRELVHSFQMKDHFISCLVSSKNKVLIGTQEGYCVSYSSNLGSILSKAKPTTKCVWVSDHSIDSITCTSECIWVSHTNCISFLNSDSLALKGSVSRDNERDVFIGQLSVSPAENTVWSAHLGGIILTAWNSHSHTRSFDIDTCEVLTKISNSFDKGDAVITAMLPALDTVWVGMATGHIMIFHKEELLTWFQPYTEYVRFLTLISSSGPCQMEKCMVVSGGKGFIPLPMVEDMGPEYEKKDQPLDKTGVLIIWEVFEAKTLRQIKLVEKEAPDYLDSHSTVQKMIHDGSFKDGTCINSMEKNKEGDSITHQESTPNTDAPSNAYPSSTSASSTVSSGLITESSSEPPKTRPILKIFYDDTAKEPVTMVTTTTQIAEETDMFEVINADQEVVRVRCPRPPQLKVLLSKLEANMSPSKADCKLEYQQASGSIVKVDTQEQLETYLALAPSKPKLSVNLQAHRC